MKIDFQNFSIPYPLSIMRGRLRLCGVDGAKIESMISELSDENQSKIWSEQELVSYIDKRLQTERPEIINSFNTVNAFENLRSLKEDIPPIIVVVEGASATGKSMIALDILHTIASTRFISTDTIRLILRNMYPKEECPELHCHTYQAFKYRQVGESDLRPMIRGYNAQSELVSLPIIEMVKRIILEGTIAVIEGVHIQPGSMNDISKGVLEILINPNESMHEGMFASKSTIGKLKSVSTDENVRREEFISARMIQEHLVSLAVKNDVAIINLDDYEQAQQEIYRLIVKKMNQLISSYI
ncbi:hypothetical protein EU527_09465 [Candidatus Thorarchaeota archaeon]|nr:MAG: hypothetical protein EU527_09465 [Candidatus Thorarchaeota archaeon]